MNLGKSGFGNSCLVILAIYRMFGAEFRDVKANPGLNVFAAFLFRQGIKNVANPARQGFTLFLTKPSRGYGRRTDAQARSNERRLRIVGNAIFVNGDMRPTQGGIGLFFR